MGYERDTIRRMHGYTWGEQPEDPRVVKLNTNENPWPPSPAVGRALAAFDPAGLRRYPSPFAAPLREAAARLHDLPPDWIMATNGGDELLRLLVTTFLEPGRPLGSTDPTYSLYPVLAAVQGSEMVTVPLADDFSLPPDLAGRLRAAGAGVVCIVNPHAPSGRLHGVEQLDELASGLDCPLLIDEAYVDFVDPALGHDCVELVRRHPNVLLLRTLSKGYALAGLRCAYGIGQPALLEPMLTKTRDSYNLDALAQTLGAAALSDRAWTTANAERVRTERQRLRQALLELGLDVPESQTNFLLAGFADAARARATHQQLKAAGILVRHFDAPNLDHRLRISVGTPEEDDALLAVLGASATA